MRIENPGFLKTEGYLRIEDLEGGECFTFLNDDNLFMKADNGDDFINVESGEIIEIYDDRNNNYEDRPIKRVNVKVTIL